MLGLPVVSASVGGYWGPVTASIDWCEENYRWTYFIAEWWNTLSSLAIFAAGMYGFSIALLDGQETRFQVSHLLVASIGIGSACFHCTLRHVEQQCDETPMVLSQLNWFHELFADVWENNSLASAVMPVFLAIYGVVFAALHNHYRWTTGFQVHFISWVVMNLGRCVYVSRDKAMEPATFLLRRAIVASSMGTICWMVDFHFCGQLQSGVIPNPEGHAWWHIFVAYAIFQCTSFSTYRRCVHLERPVSIRLKGPWGVWADVRVHHRAIKANKCDIGSSSLSHGVIMGIDGDSSNLKKIEPSNGSGPMYPRHMLHVKHSCF